MSDAVIGYARVSSIGQSLDVQLDKLQKAGCIKIFKEKKSALDSTRPQLDSCLSYLREGDTLVISRLDRLARSTLHLTQIAADLEKQGISLTVLDQAIDTSTSTGRLLFNMLGAIAQFETELRKERQADGIFKARERGVHFGRKPKLTPDQIAELQAQRRSGVLIKHLMSDYGVSKATVYRLIHGTQFYEDVI